MASSLIIDLVFQIGAVILILAIIDYFYQWWEHNQSLKMSKEEIKQEFKQAEGDPAKGKIKERQRAMAMQRMMQEKLPKLVLSLLTRLILLLRYAMKGHDCALIAAKGSGFFWRSALNTGSRTWR